MSKKLQAVILAGGRGSRLKPYTTILPKPLLPIGEYPIAEIIIRQLKFFGIEDVVISTGHLVELIESYFGDGKKWGVNIRYVREDKSLGTAGALKLIKDLRDDFLVINGDTLTNMDFRTIFRFHRAKGGIATITMKKCVTKADFGVIYFDADGKLMDYREKPETTSFFSLGVNLLNKRCIGYIEKNETIGMPDLMLRMKSAGEEIYCHQTHDIWFDLGRMADLQEAQDIFEKKKGEFLRS